MTPDRGIRAMDDRLAAETLVADAYIAVQTARAQVLRGVGEEER